MGYVTLSKKEKFDMTRPDKATLRGKRLTNEQFKKTSKLLIDIKKLWKDQKSNGPDWSVVSDREFNNNVKKAMENIMKAKDNLRRAAKAFRWDA